MAFAISAMMSCEIETSGNGDLDGFWHFYKTDSSLHIFDPYKDNRTEGDIKIEDPSELYHLGINAIDETFIIEQLEGSRMTLVTDVLRLSFRKM